MIRPYNLPVLTGLTPTSEPRPTVISPHESDRRKLERVVADADALVESGAASYVDLSRLELLSASRLAESWATTPHFHLGVVTPYPSVLQSSAGGESRTRVTLTDAIVHAVGRAAARHPRTNAWWIDGRLLVHKSANVGIAVATDYGLIVPVLRDVQSLTLSEVAQKRREIVQRARARRVAPDEMIGGTITVSNVAPLGVHAVLPIVNPPQTTIVGVGAPLPPVKSSDGVPESPDVLLWLTVGGDHRALGGAEASRFLADVTGCLAQLRPPCQEA